MKKINNFITDILKDDVESLEIIEAELNNHSIPEHDIYINNNDYYLKRNAKQPFSYEQIYQSINRLLDKGHIEGMITDPKTGQLKKIKQQPELSKIDPAEVWFRMSR